MAEQKIEEIIQSVTRAVSRANRAIRSDPGSQYGVSELEISAPISGLSVGEDVLVETDGEEATSEEGYLRFRVVPVPKEETESLREEALPRLQDRPIARSLQVLLDRGFELEQIQLAFDPDADAEPGTVISYRVEEARGIRPPEIVLTVAGEPPDQATVGDLSARATSETTSTVGKYRRREDSDTWHFCRNCSNYPTEAYKESSEKPSSGELCNQCQAKKKADRCE